MGPRGAARASAPGGTASSFGLNPAWRRALLFEQAAEDIDRRLGGYAVTVELRGSASIASAADYAWDLERLREAVEPGFAGQRRLSRMTRSTRSRESD